jgi:uncharacterized protein YecT (DUF1311 family)
VAVRKRHKACSEEQLIRDHPAIYADLIDAEYPTVTEAALAAGLKRPRTRLHELKNAWSKSRLQEWDQLSEKIVPSSNERMRFDIFLVLTSQKRSHQLKQLAWPNFIKLNDGVPFFLPLDISAAPEFFYAPRALRRPQCSFSFRRPLEVKPVSRPLLDEF